MKKRLPSVEDKMSGARGQFTDMTDEAFRQIISLAKKGNTGALDELYKLQREFHHLSESLSEIARTIDEVYLLPDGNKPEGSH